jgi:Fe-S cluster assembly ATP-binding protein
MLKENILEIKNLSVAVEGKNILHDVNLEVEMGETHVLFGPNGGGKSTLLMTIMGSPKYRVTGGSIIYKGQDIVNLPIDERARLGIGMSVQRPPVIRGVKTRDLVAACLHNRGDNITVEEIAEMADMTDFLNRDVNYGFSGGEVKRSEMMQLLAQSPELALLDEPESGVDLVNISLIGNLINDLLQKEHPMRDRKRSGLIITHTGHILDFVSARTGYVMLEGTIVCEGDPREILDTIKKKGYEECKKCAI